MNRGVHGFWMKSSHKLDGVELTDIGGAATAARRYCAVDEALVGAAAGMARLSFEGPMTTTLLDW
jgi:hypothetical protein